MRGRAAGGSIFSLLRGDAAAGDADPSGERRDEQRVHVVSLFQMDRRRLRQAARPEVEERLAGQVPLGLVRDPDVGEADRAAQRRLGDVVRRREGALARELEPRAILLRYGVAALRGGRQELLFARGLACAAARPLAFARETDRALRALGTVRR